MPSTWFWIVNLLVMAIGGAIARGIYDYGPSIIHRAQQVDVQRIPRWVQFVVIGAVIGYALTSVDTLVAVSVEALRQSGLGADRLSPETLLLFTLFFLVFSMVNLVLTLRSSLQYIDSRIELLDWNVQRAIDQEPLQAEEAERIETDGGTPFPSTTDDDPADDAPVETSGAGLVGGAITGAVVGIAGGSGGSILGAIVGAAVGDTVEREALAAANKRWLKVLIVERLLRKGVVGTKFVFVDQVVSWFSAGQRTVVRAAVEELVDEPAAPVHRWQPSDRRQFPVGGRVPVAGERMNAMIQLTTVDHATDYLREHDGIVPWESS